MCFAFYLARRRCASSRSASRFTKTRRAAASPEREKRYRTVCLLVVMLTELAVGLGLPSAPGVANAVRPEPRDKYFTHGNKLGPPLPRPPSRDIKLAKN